jgi:hypothetical protein
MRRTSMALPALAALFLPASATPTDGPEAEVRGTFERFVAAQNAHVPAARPCADRGIGRWRRGPV